MKLLITSILLVLFTACASKMPGHVMKNVNPKVPKSSIAVDLVSDFLHIFIAGYSVTGSKAQLHKEIEYLQRQKV